MSLDTFEKQKISHKVTRLNEKGTKTTLHQVVTMTAPIHDGELIRVTSQKDGSCIASVERNEGKYFLDLSSAIFNGKGETLPFADKKFEILEDPIFPPITLGAGLEDELIVTVSFGEGKEGKVKITPTSITLTYEGKTYSYSSTNEGYCFDMNLSASVVEGMFERAGHDSHFFRTPVIFGRGEKCPLYLLGMYASQIDENELVTIGEIKVFKVKTKSMSEPVVFFAQKNDLFLYNKGKIERAKSHHFVSDKSGNISLAIERTGDVSYLKIPLGIVQTDLNSPVEIEGNDEILKLFEGFHFPYKQGDTSSNGIFKLPSQISPIAEDLRKWTVYEFANKPLSQKVNESNIKEIPFQVVMFNGDDNVYYVNPSLRRLFTLNDGKFSWKNYADFADLIERGEFKISAVEMAIQNIDDKIIIANKTDSVFKLISAHNEITDLSKKDYEELLGTPVSSETSERDLDTSVLDEDSSSIAMVDEEEHEDTLEMDEPARVTPIASTPTEATSEIPDEILVAFEDKSYVVNLNEKSVICLDTPSDSLDFNNFIFDARTDTDFLQKIVDWNSKKPESVRIDYLGIIRTISEERTSSVAETASPATEDEAPHEETTPAEETTSAKPPAEETTSAKPPTEGAESAGDKPKKAENKPKERKVDHKKRAETLSTIAMSLGLFATLVGAIFAPWLVVVGLVATIGGGITTTFSDVFKYSVFDKVKSKVSKAEKEERARTGRERELERTTERFTTLDRTFDEAERTAFVASDALRELCTSEIGETDSTASLFRSLCDEYGMKCPTHDNSEATMDFDKLSNADNLEALSYRTGLVEQMDTIAKTTDPEVRAKLIDNFFSTNFSVVPAEKREEFSAIFENNASLGNLRNSLQSLNIAQQKMQEALENQREFFGDEKLGTSRIARATKSLSGEAQIKFFERYGDIVAYEISRHPEKMSVVMERTLQNVSEENKAQIMEILDNAQRRLSYALDETITAIAREHNTNVNQLESARAYAEIMSASEGIEREPVSTTRMLSTYTQGVYNHNLTEEEGELYGFVYGIDEHALDADEVKILDSVKEAISSSALEDALTEINKTMLNNDMETKIDSLVGSGMMESLLPKASAKNFNASKSIFSIARIVAQAEVDSFDREYLIKRQKRTGSEYVVRRSNPKLKLKNSAEILASRAKSQGVIGAVQYANLIVSQENLNQTNVLLEVAKALSALDSTISADDVATKMDELKTFPLRMPDEDLAIVAKAKIIAEKRRDSLTSLVTGSTEEEQTVNEKASLYANVSTFIDIAMNGRLADVRVANGYDCAMDVDHGKATFTPADACGATEQEREFNGKFQAYLASLSTDEQDEIQRELSTREDLTVQDKREVLSAVIGQKRINVSGLTYQQFVASHTRSGKIDIELAGIHLEEMREQEAERTRRQMLPQEDKFAGIKALNGHALRDTLITQSARLNGVEEERYETIIDWIVSTQKIARNTVLAAYEKASSQGNLSNGGLTTALFEELGINNENTRKQFRIDHKKIKNLKLKKSFGTLERQEAKDLLALQEAKTEMEFKSKFDSLCDKILTNGLTTSNYIELSSLLNTREYQTVTAKLGINPEMLEGVLTNPEARESAVRQIEEIINGEVYAEFARKVETKTGLISIKSRIERDSLVTKHEALVNNVANYCANANEFLTIIESEESISHDSMISAITYLTSPEHEDFVRETFGAEYLDKVKTIPADFASNIDEVYNSFIASYDVITAGEDEATPVIGKIRERIAEVMSSKADTIAELETAIVNSESNAEERFELLKLRKQKELYSQKATEFTNIYSQFIKNPNLRVMQQALLSFVRNIDNSEFLTISGLSPLVFERLVDECKDSSKAKEIAETFENKNNLAEIATRGEKRLSEKEHTLLALQDATSQEEIDDAEEAHNESIASGNRFNSQLSAIQTLPQEEQADALNNLFRYYALLSKLNALENTYRDYPSAKLTDQIEEVEAKIDQIKGVNLEYLPLPLDSFDIEEDRMFAGQMYFSYDYLDDMVEDDIPPVDPTLTGEAKKKAMAKRKKQLAKRAKSLQKNLKSLKENIKSRQDTMKKEKEERKHKLEIEKKEKQTSVQDAKKGLSILGKLFGNFARKQNNAKENTKSASATEVARTDVRVHTDEGRTDTARPAETSVSRE